MSDYTTHTWSNGDDFDAAAANGWDGRIDDLATAHEATQTAIQGDVTAAESDIADLVALSTVLPASPSGAQTANYTTVTADVGTNLATNGTFTVKIAAYGSAVPAGSIIEIQNNGTGVITIVGDTGVTLHVRGGSGTLTQQWAIARARKTATNTWSLNGELG